MFKTILLSFIIIKMSYFENCYHIFKQNYSTINTNNTFFYKYVNNFEICGSKNKQTEKSNFFNPVLVRTGLKKLDVSVFLTVKFQSR